MNRLLFLLFCCSFLDAMQLATSNPSSPLRQLTPKEIATTLSVRLFEKQDDEVITVFTQILTKDKKGNASLLEMRWRMITILEQERMLCGDTH